MSSPRIAFLASSAAPAQQALAELTARYGQWQPEQADVLCPLAVMASCCRPCTGMVTLACRCSG
jgi:hypothetical protein